MHCRECEYTWRPVKKHHTKDSRWVKGYLLDGTPLRRLGEKWKVDASTVWRRIQRSMKHIPLNTVVAFQFPKEISIILLDAKYFVVRRKVYTLYVAFDPIRKKPLLWTLIQENEGRNGYDRLLAFLKAQKMSIGAIVSDSFGSIDVSVQRWYPKAVHQRCAAHILMHAFRQIRGRYLIRTEYGRRLWKIITKTVLGYKDETRARAYLLRNKRKHLNHDKTWKVLNQNLSNIYQFSRRPDLPIPRTSNQIENFMGILEQRLKTFRSIKSPESLSKILTALIRIKYKRPTN